MKYRGNRIIFDNEGKIWIQTGEAFSENEDDLMPWGNIEKLDYIDLEFGSVDFNKFKIIGIDVKSKIPILEEIVLELSESENRMQELEKRNADLAYELMMSKGGN